MTEATMTTQAPEKENPLGHKPIRKLLRSFALPAIISCLVNSIYNIVDQIFIGQESDILAMRQLPYPFRS